jgi:hypothetical protein
MRAAVIDPSARFYEARGARSASNQRAKEGRHRSAETVDDARAGRA